VVKSQFLKRYNKIKHIKIHEECKVGVVNGLWANTLGNGGIIPIECVFFPSSTFLELQLTGLQGDVMKESMNIAKSLAWRLTPLEKQKELLNYFETTKCQGLHIHCPEGAVSKDGPSAGAAITLAIYSLFNNIKIDNKIAITGEINLQGNITQIGGLEQKINGGIKAGITTFYYPFENEKDVVNYKKKYKTPILPRCTPENSPPFHSGDFLIDGCSVNIVSPTIHTLTSNENVEITLVQVNSIRDIFIRNGIIRSAKKEIYQYNEEE
jgi:ATP-dependent Lon protease